MLDSEVKILYDENTRLAAENTQKDHQIKSLCQANEKLEMEAVRLKQEIAKERKILGFLMDL